MKNNKGITLIALIITIIVMLILVAVTVSVVVNSNLIGTAQGAKTNTELAYGEEANMSGFNIVVNGEEKYFNNTEEYMDYLNGNGGAGEGPEVEDPEGEDPEPNGDIQVSEAPDYKFYLAGLTFLIDSNTTFKQCVDASGGTIAFGTPYEHMDGTTISIVSGTKGGTLAIFDSGYTMIPTWMCGAIPESQTVLSVANWQAAGYMAFGGESKWEELSGSSTFDTVKENCEANGYLFGYVETID